ncbi:MAG: M20 family metallopeptidase [Candidatus Competibacterales bacterium]
MEANAPSAAVDLARQLIRFDTRSSLSNLPAVEYLAAELRDFQVETLDYRDAAGVTKGVLVAHRGAGSGPCVALSGHLDTVPPLNWQRNPFDPALEDGWLYGLGSTDMKGPVAAAIAAARRVTTCDVLLLLTADEEVTKAGARHLAAHSQLLRSHPPAGIVVVEPTELCCVRGHRARIELTVEPNGHQAHSATGQGRNANWDLIPFLSVAREIHWRLRRDPAFQDPAYDPPWCDLNLVIDNFGTAVNITPARAVAQVKLRHSRAVDLEPAVAELQAAAAAHNLAVSLLRDGQAPELAVDHPLVQAGAAVAGRPPQVVGYGTDASELAAVAPCIVMGPGTIAHAHRPEERIAVAELEAAVPALQEVVEGYARAVETRGELQ